MSIFRRVWLWLTVAFGTVTVFLWSLWRKAVRARDEAREQRDAAVASAKRTSNLREREEAAAREAAAARLEFQKRDDVARKEVASAEAVAERSHAETAAVGLDPDNQAKQLDERMGRR